MKSIMNFFYSLCCKKTRQPKNMIELAGAELYGIVKAVNDIEKTAKRLSQNNVATHR